MRRIRAPRRRPMARLAADGHHFGHGPEPQRRGLPRRLPRRTRRRRPARPTRSSSSTTARRMPLPRSRSPRAPGSSPSRCAASGPRRRPDSTRHPATCSPASTPIRCRRPDGSPRSSGACRGPTGRRSSPVPASSTAPTASCRWIARNIYIGGYFTVIGALLGHPPIFGSNYAMRRDAWLELRDIVHRDRADVHDDLDLVVVDAARHDRRPRPSA